MGRFGKIYPGGSEVSNIESDFASAQKVGMFRVSQDAVYVPKFISWEYIALKDIRRAVNRTRNVSASCCCATPVKVPSIVLEYGGGQRLIEINTAKDAEKMCSLLKNCGVNVEDAFSDEKGM